MVSNMPLVLILMGVSGCGKTTIGQDLAAHLGWPFFDGDDFHPPENIARMAAGVPLDDAGRAPWLDRLAELIHTHIARGESAVLACSALKKSYRDRLRQDSSAVKFIYLQGDFDLIWSRMQARSAHYMPPALLHSQFADLEPPAPSEALVVSIDQPPAAIIAAIGEALGI